MLRSNIPNFYQLLLSKNHASFHDSNLDEICLEDFLLPCLESCSSFPQLTKIIKFVMVLSHGQSAVERGLSAIKNHLIENLHEKSIQYQRMVIGYMKSNGYNSYDVPIGQKLIKSVKGSQVCGMKRERISWKL